VRVQLIRSDRSAAATGTIVLVALLVLLGFGEEAQAAYPGANGKIAFSRLVCDTQCGSAIYTVEPDGSGLTRLSGTDVTDEDPAWSPDGQKIAFTHRNIPDPQQPSLIDSAIYVMDADGGNVTAVTPFDDGILDFDPTWSPDGQKLAFARADNVAASSCSGIYTIDADGSALAPLLPSGSTACKQDDPAWSPQGDLVAFDGGTPGNQTTYTVRLEDGQVSIVFLGKGSPDWALSGDRVAYSITGGFGWRALGTATGASFMSTTGLEYTQAVWSPDGSRFAIAQNACCDNWGIYTMDDSGRDVQRVTSTEIHSDYDPNWQPLPPLPPQPGYARPRGAGPLTVPLVPAYAVCASPNNAHGAPLSFGSCSPPRQSSTPLTFGTPDANGAAANSVGRVTFKVRTGNPATPANEADVLVDIALTDVRCKFNAYGLNCPGGAMSDYAGNLRLHFTGNVRVTDRYSGGTEGDSATLAQQSGPDWSGPVISALCAATADDSIGSSCGVQTSLNAIIPDSVHEGRRAIWALPRIAVYDEGLAAQSGQSAALLAVQGVFVP
jgi:TolB protein